MVALYPANARKGDLIVVTLGAVCDLCLFCLPGLLAPA